MELFTVGYEGRTLPQPVRLLREQGVTRLVGVRDRPTSRKPGFSALPLFDSRPVAEFIDGLSDEDAGALVAAMKEVATDGMRAARHLRGDIYEVRADGERATYRILFALEGRRGQVLLALEALAKRTQKTPPAVIALAEHRLADWRKRGGRTSRDPGCCAR